MKNSHDLYIENNNRSGFAVRHISWDSGFAIVKSVDGKCHGKLKNRVRYFQVVIATIYSREGVRKEELDSASEPVWVKVR
ncbi:hypothetical protein JRY02_20820 [Enterobacter roggenkampii]|nr:hypothetical protein [Enterobacter roggenkampii]